jgi:hypothetical protein
MKVRKKILLLGAFIAFTFVIGKHTLLSTNRPVNESSSNPARLTNSPDSGAKTQMTQPPEKSQSSQFDGGFVRGDLTLTDYVRRSKWIVLATSQSTEVREVSGGNIFTFARFEVLDSVKGDFPDKILTLRVLGGRLGNVEVTPPFEKDFIAARKYVLFLGAKNEAGYPTITPQAIFLVERDPDTDQEIVLPVPADLPLYDSRGGKPYKGTPGLVSLDDFLFSLRKVK